MPRKLALPGVGLVLSAGCELVSPGVLGAVKPAARGKLPFGLGRQILAGPSREAVGDVGVRSSAEGRA